VVVTEVWTAKTFDLFLDNDPMESKPNPYGFIPFVIFPNLCEPKKFWGSSDIPSLVQPQRELNRALSQLSRILELSGNPIAVLENIASAEDIKVQPGALWTIPEDAKAYLLDLLQGGGVRLHAPLIADKSSSMSSRLPTSDVVSQRRNTVSCLSRPTTTAARVSMSSG